MAAQHLAQSVDLIYRNFRLFRRPWAHVHRSISGKYRVSAITEDISDFDFLRSPQDPPLNDGIYLSLAGIHPIRLANTTADLQDFFFANGGFNGKDFELLSYYSDDKIRGDGSAFSSPPGVLPPSETEGRCEMFLRDDCFSNVPELFRDYIPRPDLESELAQLLLDDKRPIVTLRGRGGIGKTSTALRVIGGLQDKGRYKVIAWFSARDVDLHFTGPKPVRPSVLSPEDMSSSYARLVLSATALKDKKFNARCFFEQQLQNCELGPALFVFDNFETTQNPIEVFNWIDSFIRLPNKALITTRLRKFKGDYPLEVLGMNDAEARLLISRTAESLGVAALINDEYVSKLIEQSSGHPYIIKVLLGEVAKVRRAADIPHLLAGSDDILTALFERTYAALSPCSRRAFLTLSAWNSAVPRLALEAVLFRSTEQRQEVEKGIESLLQYSIAEVHDAPADKQEFIGLPLVASVFGKKKLSISPSTYVGT
jgi:hypothetical protein